MSKTFFKILKIFKSKTVLYVETEVGRLVSTKDKLITLQIC